MQKPSITTELQQEIGQALKLCMLFEDERAIRNFVQVTPSLQPLEARLPHNSPNQQQMHLQLINYLAAHSIEGKNGLALFLQEASKLLDPALDYHHTLLNLAMQAQKATTCSTSANKKPELPIPDTEHHREGACADANLVRVCLEPTKDNWELLIVNDSDQDLRRVYVILEPPTTIYTSQTKFRFDTICANQKTIGQPLIIQPSQQAESNSYSLPFSIVYVTSNKRERITGTLSIPA